MLVYCTAWNIPMPRPPIADPSVDIADPAAGNLDRRRPGRTAVKPELISLLRGKAGIIESHATQPDEAHAITSGADQVDGIEYQVVADNDHADLKRAEPLSETEDRYDEDRESNPARGILIALLLSVPLWAIIGGIAYWIFG